MDKLSIEQLLQIIHWLLIGGSAAIGVLSGLGTIGLVLLKFYIGNEINKSDKLTDSKFEDLKEWLLDEFKGLHNVFENKEVANERYKSVQDKVDIIINKRNGKH